jgi:hypothetical protein
MTQWATGAPISDDDDDDGEWDNVGECSHCQHQGITGTLCTLCEDYGFIHESVGVRRRWQEQRQRTRLVARTWQQRVAAGVLRLMRVGKAGNNLPERGQHCLVLRGEERKDLGQEAVVTKLTAARVHIAYHDANGQQATRVKHPASLVLLDDGLHVVQDPMGFVWIKLRT